VGGDPQNPQNMDCAVQKNNLLNYEGQSISSKISAETTGRKNSKDFLKSVKTRDTSDLLWVSGRVNEERGGRRSTSRDVKKTKKGKGSLSFGTIGKGEGSSPRGRGKKS